MDPIIIPTKGSLVQRPYYHGAFEKYSELPLSGINPFDSEDWIEYAHLVLQQITKNPVGEHLFSIVPLIRDAYVKRGAVKIVDFGGGIGDNFI